MDKQINLARILRGVTGSGQDQGHHASKMFELLKARAWVRASLRKSTARISPAEARPLGDAGLTTLRGMVESAGFAFRIDKDRRVWIEW